MLREPLIPLYTSYTEQSLNFASAVLKVVLNDGVRPCLLEGDTRDVDRQAGWELVANSLLSGVMVRNLTSHCFTRRLTLSYVKDFLERQDSGMCFPDLVRY